MVINTMYSVVMNDRYSSIYKTAKETLLFLLRDPYLTEAERSEDSKGQESL